MDTGKNKMVAAVHRFFDFFTCKSFFSWIITSHLHPPGACRQFYTPSLLLELTHDT